ncbi:MAG: thioredoxin domain-containing protein [Deltaproteobacteria bacterium]|nr:thioredoxin domain-containing protein [Deltaproteobacteria bacterium]
MWDRSPAPIIIGLLLQLFACPIRAQTPTCDRLEGAQRKAAEAFLNSQRLYACCSDSIAACLKQKPTCTLAVRLADNLCRRIARGQETEELLVFLSRRERSMSPTVKKATIDLKQLPAAGDPQAPVVLVEYACPRCPYCAKSTQIIYEAVVNGALKGKVKLYFKTFPLSSHRHSKESGLAFIAAAKLGYFWEYALYFFRRFNQFWVAIQADWAKAVGMDREAFSEAMADPATRDMLIAGKKEGIVNNVDATPTYFINSRKYIGDLDKDELVDVLLEEYERVTGIRCRP